MARLICPLCVYDGMKLLKNVEDSQPRMKFYLLSSNKYYIILAWLNLCLFKQVIQNIA